MISGHTHETCVKQYDGKFFINPGSATGAYTATNSAPKPSFILLAVQGDDVVFFTYSLVNDEVVIDTEECTIKK